MSLIFKRFISTTNSNKSFKLPWFSKQLQRFGKQLEAQPQFNESIDNEDKQRELKRQQERMDSSNALIKPSLDHPIINKDYDHHKYSTAWFKISHKKLNDLGRQITGKPIDSAILQMQFSEKRASNRIKSTLALARDHAVAKGFNRSELVVKEAFVNRGLKHKRMDIKGRMRTGIKEHPQSKLHIILTKGQSVNLKKQLKYSKSLNKVRSASIIRESPKIINNKVPYYNW